MSTPRTELLEQVAKARAGITSGHYATGSGMAIFVTPGGIRCTRPESREFPKLLLQYGAEALAGIYTRACPLEWMEADVLEIANDC